MTNATPQIHYSARTLKEIGLPPKSIGYGDPETDQFFCWYCNLLYINRKKHLMFVNAATRYPLLSEEVTRDDIRSLDAVLALTVTRLRYGVTFCRERHRYGVTFAKGIGTGLLSRQQSQ